MPNQPRESNRHRSVRFEQDEWDVGEAVTEEMGTNRTQILNQFLRWYLRKPGVKLPPRPPAELVEQVYAEYERQQAQAEPKDAAS